MKDKPLQISLIVCFSSFVACFAQSTYYVTPRPNTPCPGSEEPCQTLSEYVANGTFKNLPKNATIQFLPGNHTLNNTITLKNLISLAVLGDSSSLPEVTSRIVCTWPAGFTFTDITELHINALAIISCGYKNIGSIKIQSGKQSHISGCTFESNYATNSGGAIIALYTSIRLSGNTFQNDSSHHHIGGAIYALDSKVDVTNNTFQGNSAGAGGAIAAIGHGGTLTITTNTFQGNSAFQGGAVYAQDGILNITNNTFHGNSAMFGGAIMTIGSGTENITSNAFQNNSAKSNGGAIVVVGGTVSVTTNTFLGNSADRGGGAIDSERVRTLDVTTNTFLGNSAAYGGAIIVKQRNRTHNHRLTSNTFQNNSARIGGALHSILCSITLTGNAFRKNFALSSGGALAAYGSTINLSTTPNPNNVCSAAEDVRVLDQQLHVACVEKATVDSNRATLGGGMYVVNTTVHGNITFTENSAIEGGALFAYRGTLFFKGTTTVANNSARIGGGLLLLENSKLFLPSSTTIQFINNIAIETGGALHVKAVNYVICVKEPETISVYQSFENDCFFQIELNKKQPYAPNNTNELREFIQSLKISLHFENNSAKYAGVDLYGGMVDMCLLNSIKENPAYYDKSYSGVVFDAISSGESKPNITSDPLRFCICADHCNVYHYSQSVYPGGTVQVPVTVLGQRNQPTIATIHVVDISNSITLQPLEYSQNIGRGCNTLMYTIHSNAIGTTQGMTLHPNGPCASNNPVTVTLDIQQCPSGFQLSHSESCCTCDQRLLQYTDMCVVANETVLRPHNAEFWVGYSDVKGLILHPHCPFDYCTTEEMYLEVTHSDEQCNSNRSGLLCGRCSDNCSIALGSSHCLQCSNSYLSLLAAFALAGIALVLFLLSFRLTVAAGTISGLIFYANVVTMNSMILFRPEISNVLTVFIAWINLDLGIETCFYNGMDAYGKTWLQFVFPVYVLGLVGVMIVGSNYSGRMAKLIGRNPIAVLATLVLLSYAKLLRTTIAALSYTTLEYPNSQIAVWLYDGNIGYLSSKHIPLFVVALVCLLFFVLPYTTLLTVTQWLQAISDWRVFSWIHNRYMFSFLDAYHAPYSTKRRYCIGVMLVLRLVLFFVSAVNVLGDPRINLLAVLAALTFITPTILAGSGVYKSWCLSVLELSFLVNLIILVSITLYIYPDQANQNAITFASVSIAFVTFIGIVIYHSIQQIKATQPWTKLFPRPQYMRVPLDDEDGNEEHPSDCVYVSRCAPTQTVVDIRELRQERMRNTAECQETHDATTLRDPWLETETHEPQNPIESQEPLNATY